MASNLDYVKYVCEQISGAGEITNKKMFGEYGVYCNEKIIGVICDNRFFVKKTESAASLCPGCEEAAPYAGAKACFVIDDIDDRDFMTRLITAVYNDLPPSKPRKKNE